MSTTATLSNEQIARVFAMYLHSKADFMGGKYTTPVSLRSIDLAVSQGWQIILTPLSAISDEDAEAVCSIIHRNEVRRSHVVNGWHVVNNLHEDLNKGTSMTLFQFLIQRGYAVPLFIDVDHPDNGKTAIELGIATLSPK